MDDLIQRFDSTEDGDLTLCLPRGVAYQTRMIVRAQYDGAYFDKCRSYEDQEIAVKINAGRVALVNKHVGADGVVLDIGVGSGEFVRKRDNTFGYDINPVACQWLKEKGLWREDLPEFRAFSFWDVIEHLPTPGAYFKAMAPGSYLFTCLPIFEDLSRIRESKHYRPGEHLYYWTRQGFLDWMQMWGFSFLEEARFETEAGRDSIQSFAFKRGEASYHYLLGQYQTLHSTRHYGHSGHLYLDLIAPSIFKLDPKTILDYGCGRSDLVAYFWGDGRRKLDRYDPAIPEYETMAESRYDLALCCDVMEHIAIRDVDRVLTEIRSKSARVIFAISLKPARAKLPDGQNAHVTLLTRTEWTRWIASIFGQVSELGTPWEHVLLLKTF